MPAVDGKFWADAAKMRGGGRERLLGHPRATASYSFNTDRSSK
jgi:hypothetical protein